MVCTINFKEFKKALKNAVLATSNKKGILNNVACRIENHKIIIYGCDGYRMNLSQFNCIYPNNESFCIPKDIAKEIFKNEGQNISFVTTKKYIYISIDENIMYEVEQVGECLNYKDVFSSCHKPNSKISINKKELQFKTNKQFIMLNNNELLEYDEININLIKNLNCKIEGDPVTIAINKKYLLHAIKELYSKEILIEYINSVNPLIFKQEQNNISFINLVLPVRVFKIQELLEDQKNVM